MKRSKPPRDGLCQAVSVYEGFCRYWYDHEGNHSFEDGNNNDHAVTMYYRELAKAHAHGS